MGHARQEGGEEFAFKFLQSGSCITSRR